VALRSTAKSYCLGGPTSGSADHAYVRGTRSISPHPRCGLAFQAESHRLRQVSCCHAIGRTSKASTESWDYRLCALFVRVVRGSVGCFRYIQTLAFLWHVRYAKRTWPSDNCTLREFRFLRSVTAPPAARRISWTCRSAIADCIRLSSKRRLKQSSTMACRGTGEAC